MKPIGKNVGKPQGSHLRAVTGGGGRGEGVVCCTFRPFRPFWDHFKNVNFLLNVILCFFFNQHFYCVFLCFV